MISAHQIVHFKLDRTRLLAHRNMPPPPYSNKELTSQIAAIGDAVISSIMNVTPEVFQMQLEAARDFKVSYLHENSRNRICGISAATSLIKDDNILRKNVIIPRDMTRKDPRLAEHYIVSIFIRGSTINGLIPELNEVEIAGWISNRDIRVHACEGQPPTFKSKLPVVMLPCTALNPLESFAFQFNPEIIGF